MCFSQNQFKIFESLLIFSVESQRKIHFTSNWSISTTIASLCQQWMVCKELSSFRLPKMQIQFGGFALRVQAWKRIEKRNHDSGPSLKTMLMTNVGDGWCWWRLWNLDDRLKMLITDSLHWIFSCRQYNNYVTNMTEAVF